MSTGLTGLGENQVNFLAAAGDGLTGTQADPAVTALPQSGGAFAVVYENPQGGGSNIDLLAHVFNIDGSSAGFFPVDQTANVTVHPAIAPTADGGFVVAYTDVTHNTIAVRDVSPITVGAPFVVDAGNGPGHQPNVGPVDNAAVATFADGTIVVVWEFDFAHSATDHDVYFAYLNSTASGFVHAVAPIDVHNAFEGEARVATSGNTAAIVYAADPGTIAGGQDIILDLFNSSATELATPATIFGTSSSEIFSHPDVAALSDGRFVIAAHDDSAGTMQVAFYNPVTHAVTPVPGLTAAGGSPHVAGLPNGGFILSFDTTGGDIGELRVDADGSTQFTAGLANSFTTSTQSENALATDAFGTVFFAWQDAGSGNPHSSDTDTRIEGQAHELQVGPGPDNVVGGPGDDTLDGQGGNDTISGGDGNDVIFGGAGDDSVSGGIGNDTILGQDGNDTIDGGDGHDNINAGAGNDVVFGGTGNDTIGGGAGDDTIVGQDGNDVIFGEDGNDAANGGAGVDIMLGGAGNDTFGGGGDNDVIVGGDGNDLLFGEDGADNINGEAGDDGVVGGPGDDILGGGDGNDIVVGDDGNDVLFGELGNDSMNGGFGNDILIGSDGDDVLGGGAGDDDLNGGFGNDTLFGENGNDILNGSAGNDILIGGGNDDTFVFQPGDGADTIGDFFAGGLEDRIWFKGTDLHSFADVQAHLTFNAAAGTATITYNGFFTVTLNGITAGQLTSGDFIFS